jgi:hypothetical protein
MTADLHTRAVVKVGDGGRGFVVAFGDSRIVITAAHCLPHTPEGQIIVPPAHPAAFTEERTYKALLGPLGSAPKVWAECLFVDPIADLAVLGCPDDQTLPGPARSYNALMRRARPLAITDAPAQGRETVQLYGAGGSFEKPTPGVGPVRLLSLDASEWIDAQIERRGSWLAVTTQGVVKSGMSGSPIVSMDGAAIGVMSTDFRSPVLVDCLPAWLLRLAKAGKKGR